MKQDTFKKLLYSAAAPGGRIEESVAADRIAGMETFTDPRGGERKPGPDANMLARAQPASTDLGADAFEPTREHDADSTASDRSRRAAMRPMAAPVTTPAISLPFDQFERRALILRG